MESSKVFGDEEECNSSESGWTMYICSPTHSDDDDGEIDDGGGDEHEDESDDSMASDASSGPSPLEHSLGYGKIDDATYDDDKQLQVLDDNGGKQFTNKKASGKQFTNKKAKYQDQKEDHSVFAAKQAKVSVQSNGKVKKNGWFGKTK